MPAIYALDPNYKYILALAILYRFAPRKAREAIDFYGNAETAWREIAADKKDEAMLRACHELDFIQNHKIDIFTYQDENYPFRLKDCHDAPVLLFAKGNIHLNDGHFVSVVGTRRSTEYGKDLTHAFIRDLSRLVPNTTIVSGLAYGIDIAAHTAALENGLPTIIVPAHGLDRIYPPLHRPTAIQALNTGGILTEYPSGTEPERQNFVARNRIVAGISDATVVIESKEKGGSLITAQLAVDYGRDVFAFPGRPSDVNAQGCNTLIREHKAGLINSAEDLVMAMMWDVSKKPIQTEMVELFSNLSKLQQDILKLLREAEDGLHVNQIVEKTEHPYSEISVELTLMELDNLVKALPGGIYRAKK